MHVPCLRMDVALDDGSWIWGPAERTPAEHCGRACVRFDTTVSSVETVTGVELRDGSIEADIAVAEERAFHGVVWRVQDGNYESFFVRPHQTGNDDAIQYSPVFNEVSAWQLYHGPGFWAPVAFPLGEWFTIRIVFGGEFAEIFVVDLDEPVLVVRQRLEAAPGGLGLLVGGGGYRVARVAVDADARPSRGPLPEPAVDGVVPAWWVSDAFGESAPLPDPSTRAWTRLESEPSGLVNLARANGIREGRNTVYARAVVRSERAQVRELAFGFSDRARVSLNGCLLYRGDDSYRTRDYRFLGSIGYWDSLALSLDEGDNELVFAVSEDFGGWGVQARFLDLDGIRFVD